MRLADLARRNPREQETVSSRKTRNRQLHYEILSRALLERLKALVSG